MSGLAKATAAIRSLFSDEAIPEDFNYEGQTFEERCEAWVLHAVEQLDEEIETFEEEGESEGDNEAKDEES